jgi:hypothetical protein
MIIMFAFTISCSVTLFFIIVFLFAVRKNLNGLLKDTSVLPVELRSYSLSRTMLFFWTLIIFLSICYIGIVSDNLPTIDSGVLILMGIVVGTTTACRAIDSTQSQDATIARTQDTTASQGFLTDILSDDNGISISRFQTVVFNIIYGCSFLSIVITQNVLYNFPNQTLALLGISSGAYALLKIPENKAPTVTPSPVTAASVAVAPAQAILVPAVQAAPIAPVQAVPAPVVLAPPVPQAG